MVTNIIKGRFLRDNEPMGREYSYLTAGQSVAVGNVFTVETDRGEAQLLCTAINVPEEEIAGFRDKMKAIKGLVVDTEPRFMLDPDSTCYGCAYYKHINDTDAPDEKDDIDENGGVCDCNENCVCGNMNSYRMDD